MIRVDLRGGWLSRFVQNKESVRRAVSYLHEEFGELPTDGIVNITLESNEKELQMLKELKDKLNALNGLRVSVQHVAVLNQMAIA
jgi:hypothetical protein